MSPIKAIKLGFYKSTDFRTRSSRSEYWWTMLACFIMVLIFQTALMSWLEIGEVMATTRITQESGNYDIKWFIIFGGSCGLFCFVMLPLTSRRFKDRGWSGSWFYLAWWINFASIAFVVANVLTLIFDFTSKIPSWTSLTLTLLAVPYASIIWCFWIGFLRSDPNTNQYGPNSHEVQS